MEDNEINEMNEMNKIKKYDLSIIIPFYKKYEELKYSVIYNESQFSLVNEVILIIDEFCDFDKLNNFLYLLNYNINFKIYINSENHDWRNPAIVINFGIKMASSTYCLIMSPESILLDNAIKNLYENTSDNTFCVGQILFITPKVIQNLDNFQINKLFSNTPTRNNIYIGPVYFGSICCSKKNLLNINLYDDNFNEKGWGGEDNDIRTRLIEKGIEMIENKYVKLIHIENDIEYHCRLNNNYTNKKKEITQKYDNFIKLDNLLDYNLDKKLFIDKINNIKAITHFELNNIIMKDYPIILLTQAYNENNNAEDFLNNIHNCVDGIICVDDDSTDDTWDLIKSSKLLLKIKKNRITFNDLENRNLLLQILNEVFIQNNINFKWLLWLDFDERINNNLNIINSFRNTILSPRLRYNILNLPIFHMWNEYEYNTEYPYSFNGIQYHTRLIRYNKNKPMMINNTEKLHFNLNHYDDKKMNINFFIKHLGNNTSEKRNRKYELYTKKYDKDLIYQKSYEHLLNNNPKLNKFTYIKNNLFIF